jgi:thioredoxin reductase (NADPH)
VPGGHEFTSFVLGLYNAAGPGQPIDDASRTRIAAIDRPVELQVLVSLSCTNCPDVVLAAQRVAADNPLVTAEAYDINHNKELADRYNVMSVPALVIDGERVSFGKKGLPQVLDLIG